MAKVVPAGSSVLIQNSERLENVLVLKPLLHSNPEHHAQAKQAWIQTSQDVRVFPQFSHRQTIKGVLLSQLPAEICLLIWLKMWLISRCA